MKMLKRAIFHYIFLASTRSNGSYKISGNTASRLSILKLSAVLASFAIPIILAEQRKLLVSTVYSGQAACRARARDLRIRVTAAPPLFGIAAKSSEGYSTYETD